MIKKNTHTRNKLVSKLDQVFSEYIRLSVADKDGYLICPLCGQKVHRKKAQNMHFISRSIQRYRWDERNCHAGCMRCNVILHGNYIVYTRWMQKKYGEVEVDHMISDKQTFKISTREIIDLIDYYKAKNKEIIKLKGL